MKAKKLMVIVVVVVVVAIAVWMVAGTQIFRVREAEPEERDKTSATQDDTKQYPKKPAENRRAEVFRIAAEAKGKDVEKLLPYLEDESSRVRLAAAREIIAKDTMGNFERLVQLLRDKDGTVRASVAQLLAKSKSSKLIGEYAWIIYYDKEDRVKIAALDGLKEVGEEQCLPPMIEALRSKSSVIRKHAAARLRETAYHKIEGTEQGGEEAYQKWLTWWKEKKLPKYATHEDLERLKACNDVMSFLLLVESPNLASPDIKATVVFVLSTMTGDRAKQAFRKCLNSSNEMVCIAAINAIVAGKLSQYVKDLEDLSKKCTSKGILRKVILALDMVREH